MPLTDQQRVILLALQNHWSWRRYIDFCSWLQITRTYPTTKSKIHTPLIETITQCLPLMSSSIHMFLILEWTRLLEREQTTLEQQQIHSFLITNPNIQARLITVFANFPIPPSYSYTSVLENTSSTNSQENEILPSKTLSPQSHSRLVTLLAQRFKNL